MGKKDTPKNPQRQKWAEMLSGIKSLVSDKQSELDKAGLERKELSPDLVDLLRVKLVERIPEDETLVNDVIQIVGDVLAEAMAEEVEEEDAKEAEEPLETNALEDEEEEMKATIKALTTQVTEMGQAYVALVEDVSEVVEVTGKAFTQMSSESKTYQEVTARLSKVEKAIGEKPRRASTDKSTEVDEDSEIAKSLANRTFTPPEAFADLFEGAN